MTPTLKDDKQFQATQGLMEWQLRVLQWQGGSAGM